MTIPAKYRKIVYTVTVAVTAIATVASAFGLIPAEAVERGVTTATSLIAVISAALALANVTPD